MNSGIYKIINAATDSFYIGSAVDLRRRKARHFSELRHGKHNNGHLQAAFDLYGESNFSFIVLEYVAVGPELYEAEDKWMADHVGKKYCYNIGMAALSPMLGMKGELSPTWGYKHTAEARAKIAEAGTGRVRSPEAIAKYVAKRKGMPVSEAQKIQISRTLSGEGNFWYGKERPESFKQKIRKAVEAIDADGKTTQYESIQALREALGLKPPTVNRALKSGEALERGPFKGWRFKYVAPPQAV